MPEIVAQTPDVDGEVITYAAADAGGDFVVASGGRLMLVVRNGSAGSITVTVDDPNTAAPAGATAHDPDVSVAVAAGADAAILLDPLARFRDADGQVNLAYSAAASVTVAALRLP